MPIQTQLLAQLHCISAGCVRQHNAYAIQGAKAMGHTAVARTEFFQTLETVGIGQKMMGVSLVVPHHAKQCCTIAKPVTGAQLAGLRRVQNKVLDKILGHLAIDLRQNMGRCVVQGIVQVQQIHFARQACMGTTNITNAQNE